MKISYSRYKNCHPMQMIPVRIADDGRYIYIVCRLTSHKVDNMELTIVFNQFNLDLLPDDFKVNNGHLIFNCICVPSLVFCSAKVRATLSLLNSFSFDYLADTSGIYCLWVTYLLYQSWSLSSKGFFKMLTKWAVDRSNMHRTKTNNTKGSWLMVFKRVLTHSIDE